MEDPWAAADDRDAIQLGGDTASADPTVPGSMLSDPTVTGPDPTITDGPRARKVQIKLTSERLLSDKGLPWVLKNGPKRIRISRKRRNAHDNLDHIIQFYQLWAHELYPKAKFRDFTKLCQTLGKNDKVLRQFREDVFRSEMLGTSMDDYSAQEEAFHGVEPRGDPVARPEETDAEEDLYSVSRRDAEIDETTDYEKRQEFENMDAQLDNNEQFEEDEEALEAMKELGF